MYKNKINSFPIINIKFVIHSARYNFQEPNVYIDILTIQSKLYLLLQKHINIDLSKHLNEVQFSLRKYQPNWIMLDLKVSKHHCKTC